MLSANGQVVWALLEHFTRLVDYDTAEPLVPDVMTLEAKLLKL